MNISKTIRNTKLIRDVLAESNSEEEAHDRLDKLINSIEIFYQSKEEFEKVFPDSNDLDGKVKLLLNRGS